MNLRKFASHHEPEACVTEDAGAHEHCLRVAAWCEELARCVNLTAPERTALVHAAWRHQKPELLSRTAVLRLAEELGVSSNAYDDSSECVALADDIVDAFCSRSGSSGRVQELARILEAANMLDEHLEFSPFEPLRSESDSYSIHGQAAWALRKLRLASFGDLESVKPNLPVYPAVAARLYRLMASDDVSLSTLERVANTDQVVAGKLVKAANSALYSPWQTIRTVAQAINFVGTDEARRILMACSIQPLYSSPRMRKLWKHALEAAQVAEKIGELTGKVNPAEAFLLGLLHDVGKLAISMLSQELNESLERLTAKGCQSATCEMVLCGFDHAAAGAEVLRYWKVAEELVTAVEHHHQPEKSTSRLAAVLYLTEHWTDSEEDLPSNARMAEAIKMTALSPEVLETNLRSLKAQGFVTPEA